MISVLLTMPTRYSKPSCIGHSSPAASKMPSITQKMVVQIGMTTSITRAPRAGELMMPSLSGRSDARLIMLDRPIIAPANVTVSKMDMS